MNDPVHELTLDELPRPPFYRLVDEEGQDVFEETEVGDEPATVGVLFADEGLARGFSADASEHGMAAFVGLSRGSSRTGARWRSLRRQGRTTCS
jgi:hypothetical protein